MNDMAMTHDYHYALVRMGGGMPSGLRPGPSLSPGNGGAGGPPQVDVTANPCSSQACVPPVILLAFR